MKKRGFTLVELLGVIVVLGILATITIPIIMNDVEKSRKEAVIRSAEQMIKSITIDYTTNDNFTTDKIDILTLNLGGAKPESGYIQFDENEKVRLYMLKDGYCVAKTYETELEATKEGDFEVCDWYTSSKIDRIESSSSVLTLDDLKEGNLLSYKIYGNSYQDTRSGKNLIRPQDIFSDNAYYSEQEFEGRNTIRYIDHAELKYTGYKFKENTQYTISADVKTTIRNYDNELHSVWFVFYYTDGTKTNFIINRNSNWQHVSNTSAAGKTIESIGLMSFNYTNWIYIDVNTFQFEEGTTATSYEPYGVMPSPDFPSEIQSLGKLVTEEGPNKGKYEIPIKVTGKNLFDLTKEDFENGSDYGEGKKIEITLKPNTTYTLSSNDKNYNTYAANIWFNGGSSKENGVGDGQTRSITTDASGKLFIAIRTTELDYVFDECNIQLEEGSEATTYEEYKGENYSIYIDEPLRCVSGTCDYIDFESGKVVRNIKNYKVSRTLSWGFAGGYFGCYPNLNANTENRNYAKNNYYPIGTVSDDMVFWIDSSGQGLRIKDLRFETKDIFKSWLDTVDMYIQYALATPEYETGSLPKIKTYEGTNNIVITDGNLHASKIEVVVLKK